MPVSVDCIRYRLVVRMIKQPASPEPEILNPVSEAWKVIPPPAPTGQVAVVPSQVPETCPLYLPPK